MVERGLQHQVQCEFKNIIFVINSFPGSCFMQMLLYNSTMKEVKKKKQKKNSSRKRNQ